MKKTLNWIFGILLLVMFIICGLQFYCLHNQSIPECIQIHDTITITKDSIITKYRWKDRLDTIKEIHYKDTVLFDTIYFDIEHKVDSFTIKKDSLSITEKIKYHGYKAAIDSVELDYSWNYTLPQPKQKKFGWCVTVGPSISYGINLDTHNKTWGNGPSFGVSVVVGPSWIIK